MPPFQVLKMLIDQCKYFSFCNISLTNLKLVKERVSINFETCLRFQHRPLQKNRGHYTARKLETGGSVSGQLCKPPEEQLHVAFDAQVMIHGCKSPY